jgi:uncharacterized protein YgbK (DUF1537 family)
MNQILVTADDLTGAAEIAGIGAQFGLKARICREQFIDNDQSDLIVIDTDTRNRGEDDAATMIRNILARCRRDTFQWIYKKTDSVLRGHVAAEIEAVLDAFTMKGALLVPQNPTLGRVIRGGKYFINGVPLDQTDFARDPEHPRTSSDVRELLGATAQNIEIASGESVDDLRALAWSLNKSTLPAGGADFFTTLLESRGFHRNAPPLSSSASGAQLFVCGSSSESSRLAMYDVAAQGIKCIAMPRDMFDAAEIEPQVVRQWSDEIRQAFSQGATRVIAIVGHPSNPTRALHVRQALAAMVANVLAQHPLGALWIEGGATAAAIVDAMKSREFDVEGTLSPGVVALKAIAAPNLRIVMKPGSYAWPAGAL